MNAYCQCKVCGGEIIAVNTVYNLVQCSDCSLVFCKHIFSQQDFVATYNRLYNTSEAYKKHQLEYDKLRSDKRIHIGITKKRVLRFLSKRKCKSYIEVGAGIGLIARFIQDMGHDYLGVELDNSSAQKAQKLGLKVIQGDFSLLNTIENKFDAAVAFEVMEHIQDLDVYLRYINLRLNVGGYYGFTVPNFEKVKNYKKISYKNIPIAPSYTSQFFYTA